MRRHLGMSLAVLAGALAATAGAAGAQTGLTPPDPASPNADGIRDTYWLILALTGAIFVLVEATLVIFAIRYRSRGRARSVEGAQVHGATRFELSLTIVPVLVLAAIATFVFVKLPDIKNVPTARAGENELLVRVEGHQYYWQFEYPDGQIAVDRMVVPVDRVVRLELTSPDVIHSWWAPNLGGKVDAVPGRVNHTWFRAERTGTYEVRCAEFCGLEHAHMTGSVVVVPQAEFASFLAAHRPASATVGQEIFAGACAKCHGLAGEGDYGPPLQKSGQLADRQGLEELLRNGKNEMPAVGRDWSDDQMKAAIDYLQERFE